MNMNMHMLMHMHMSDRLITACTCYRQEMAAQRQKWTQSSDRKIAEMTRQHERVVEVRHNNLATLCCVIPFKRGVDLCCGADDVGVDIYI